MGAPVLTFFLWQPEKFELMSNDFGQDTVGPEFGQPPRFNPAGLALQMRPVDIVDATITGASDFTANRTAQTANTLSNSSNRVQVIAHGRDDLYY